MQVDPERLSHLAPKDREAVETALRAHNEALEAKEEAKRMRDEARTGWYVDDDDNVYVGTINNRAGRRQLARTQRKQKQRDVSG
jgi:hypothetical protein